MHVEQVGKRRNGRVPSITVMFAARYLACADLYDALSQGFAYPTAHLFEQLQRNQFTSTLRTALTQLPESPTLTSTARALHYGIAATISGCTLQQLESDYIALFDANRDQPPVHPIARLYLETDNNPVTVLQRLQGIYREYGLELDDDNGAEQPDHLTVQLEFMALLFRSLAQAVEKSAAEAVTAAIEDVRRFQLELAWLPRFVAELESRPIHKFYTPLGAFLRALHGQPLNLSLALSGLSAEPSLQD